MKKRLKYIRRLGIQTAMVVLMTACAAGTPAQEPAGSGATAADASAGGTAAGEAAAGTVSDGSAADTPAGTGEKPALSVLEEETGDYSRAVANRLTDPSETGSCTLFAAEGVSTKKTEIKENTVMIYVVGSNLESYYGAATSDIGEMQAAGLDYDRTNLLLYTGGSRRWNTDISNKYNSVLDMSDEDDFLVAAQTVENADMGSPETLAEFINYCTDNYPAEHYALVLWDHGGGPVWGYGSDELYGNDSLILEELRAAMDSTIFGGDQKLDWVGFDACLMGSIENADLWKDYAEYLVGSEEVESGRGWDYSFLNVLNKESDPRAVTGAIVDAYGQYYEENKSAFFDPDVTLAAYDLAQTDTVVGALDALFDAMSDEIGEGNYPSLNRARNDAKAFGVSAAGSRNAAYDLIDIRDFAEKVADLYPDESGALTKALDAMVVHATSNVQGGGGISVYLPGDNPDLYDAAKTLYLGEQSLSDPYTRFVDAYTEKWFAANDVDWTLPQMQQGSEEFTLQLTREQAENTSAARYVVLVRNGFGSYAPASVNIRTYIDENNMLHIPDDPIMIAGMTDLEESPVPWVCVQSEDNEEESVYRTFYTFLSSGHDFTDFDTQTDDNVTVVLRNKKGERDVTISDITTNSGSAWLSGKGSVDVSNYESIIDAGGFAFTPTRNEDGQMAPFYDWETNGYELYPLGIDQSFRFEMRPASEFEGKSFICQVILKDINGVDHASDFCELPGKDKDESNQISVPTGNGTLFFDIEEDRAVLTDYEGEDSKLKVPDKVEGKTVTEIGDAAFSGCSDLTEIDLPASLKVIGINAFERAGLEEVEIPDGVEKIGRGAFAESGLKTVKLPDSLQSIGKIPFSRCVNLTEISISADNPYYRTKDGVLYTADGKTLIQYPSAKGTQYSVEDGTETISYGAFAEAPLQQIHFPQTLKVIENDAFYECYTLESLELPDSLESIGDLAFGKMRLFGGLLQPEEMAHFGLRLGPNVRHIGTDAFTALQIDGFEVDKSNENYASLGGLITNKAADSIEEIPMGMGKYIVIPEGITTLQSGVFVFLDGDTEFYLPDSVFRISENAFPYSYETSVETGENVKVLKGLIHCSEGSAAETFAQRYEMAYDNESEPVDTNYEIVKDSLGSGLATWLVYSDHAELAGAGFPEEEKVLEIPDQYNGLPVTGIRYIGYEAFDFDSDISITTWRVERLVIPASVQRIDTEALNVFSNLIEIEVAKENDSFVTRDGVLFTKDGETLLYFPDIPELTEYVIPKGTEVIADRAFYENKTLEKVSMPDSLREIGKNAFGYGSVLREVEFNKGLKKIGDNAFYSSPLQDVQLPSSVESIGGLAFCVTEGFGEIVLPENLRLIGNNAFFVEKSYDEPVDGYTITQEALRIPEGLFLEETTDFLDGIGIERYEVDEGNANYSADDGLLMSRSGQELIAVPTLRSGEFRIPEGVTKVRYAAFNGCSLITDIYVPDSVLDIGNIDDYDLDDDMNRQYHYVLHCHEGSEAAKILDANDVPWVKIQE